MKKYLLIASVALGLFLVACGGGKKAENAPADESATPVVTATTDSISTDEVAPADEAPADSAAQDAGSAQ